MKDRSDLDEGFDEFVNRIAMAITLYRNARGLTQHDLAKLIGTSRARVAQFETGRFMPTIRRLWRLSQALGVKPSDLVGE